jgi:hypothetical protein
MPYNPLENDKAFQLKNLFTLPQWASTHPAHHPLDACYYLVVNEPQLN